MAKITFSIKSVSSFRILVRLLININIKLKHPEEAFLIFFFLFSFFFFFFFFAWDTVIVLAMELILFHGSANLGEISDQFWQKSFFLSFFLVNQLLPWCSTSCVAISPPGTGEMSTSIRCFWSIQRLEIQSMSMATMHCRQTSANIPPTSEAVERRITILMIRTGWCNIRHLCSSPRFLSWFLSL